MFRKVLVPLARSSLAEQTGGAITLLHGVTLAARDSRASGKEAPWR